MDIVIPPARLLGGRAEGNHIVVGLLWRLGCSRGRLGQVIGVVTGHLGCGGMVVSSGRVGLPFLFVFVVVLLSKRTRPADMHAACREVIASSTGARRRISQRRAAKSEGVQKDAQGLLEVYEQVEAQQVRRGI